MPRPRPARACQNRAERARECAPQSGAAGLFVVELVDLALESTNHDLVDPLFLGVGKVRCSMEADRIEKLEQARKTTSMPVVRSGGEKQPVLEQRADRSQHLDQIAVGAQTATA